MWSNGRVETGELLGRLTLDDAIAVALEAPGARLTLRATGEPGVWEVFLERGYDRLHDDA